MKRKPILAVAACAGLALAGTLPFLQACSESRADTVAPSGLSTDDPNSVSGIPVSDEQIEAAIQALPSLVKQAMQETGIPGAAVAVVHKDRLVYAEGFGVRSVETGEPVDADTVFQLASVSKPIGATVIAAEIAEGKIDWDTPVVQWLPDFQLSQPSLTPLVTVGDLYAHRSGLPEHVADDLESLGFDAEAILERMHLVPFVGTFRHHYAYTNYGLTYGAYAVAAAAGTDWATLSENKLYEPLGMSSTSSRHADYLAHPKRARMHMRVEGEWKPLFEFETDGASPAGGVSSSVRDMAAWLRMVLADGRFEGEQVVDADALHEALSPQNKRATVPPSHRASFYGYGFGIDYSPSGRSVIAHSGAFLAGAATAIQLIPSLDLGFVVLTNAQPIGVVERLSGEFADLVQFGEMRTDWKGFIGPAFEQVFAPWGDLSGKEPPADPAPPQDLAAYEGRYTSPYFGDAEVVARDDGLDIKLGPAQKAWSTEHWDGDVFVLDIPRDQGPEGSRSSVRFSSDLSSFVIDFFDDDGLGTFERVP